MEKNKKNISAFQKAMLSNTKMISTNNKPEKKRNLQKESVPETLSGKTDIDPEISIKLQKMAEKYKIDQRQLITLGLDLFLSLEEFWFENSQS